MSSESVQFYSEVTSYFGKFGNITAWQSTEWGTKIREASFDDTDEYQQDPSNAVKCAAEKGKCKCSPKSLIYYGLQTEDSKLDVSNNYITVEAAHSGYTFCRDQVFGDPLPKDSSKKYCFCEETPSVVDESKISWCSLPGENCDCDLGGKILYGAYDSSTNKSKISSVLWEEDAPHNGSGYCDPERFSNESSN